jgi:hypothetical protein
MIDPESKIENLIQSYLVNSDDDKLFISELKKLSASAVEMENLDLFGDQAIGQKVALIKEDIENKRPYERNLNDLKMYIKSVSGGKKNFSETEVHNMLDKELNMVSEENVQKINDKVMNMEGTLNKVEDKLDNLVEQQKSILKTVDPESAKTTDEKLEGVKDDVKTLAAAFSDLCDYVGGIPYNFDATGAPMPGAAPAPAGGAPMPGGDPSAAAAQIAQSMGLMPGAPGFNEFVTGYLAALGIPPTPPAAGGAAPAPAPAPQGFSATPTITYSETHDAFLSNDGDIYTYSQDQDGYFNQKGEQLFYSQDSDVFYSEEPKAQPEFVGTVFSAEGNTVDLYTDQNSLFSEDGSIVVYNENENAFFSESGDTLFDEKTFSEMGGFLELVESDPNGNAIFFSTETKDYYYYSAEQDKLFNEDELEDADTSDEDDNEADDDDDSDDDAEGNDDDNTEVIHVDGSDGNKIIVIDDDDSMDTKVEGDTVTIEDKDGDIDELEVQACDPDSGDAVCHSVASDKYVYYSAAEHSFSLISDEEFSKITTDKPEIDNRSPEAITTFSFIDNMINDTSDASQRYEALTNYLSSSSIF